MHTHRPKSSKDIECFEWLARVANRNLLVDILWEFYCRTIILLFFFSFSSFHLYISVEVMRIFVIDMQRVLDIFVNYDKQNALICDKFYADMC